MRAGVYGDVLDLAAGGVLLAAVAVVWRRDLPAMVRILAGQGVALSVVVLAEGVHQGDPALLGVAVAVAALRAGLLPWLLRRAVFAEAAERRESTPLLNTTASLLVAVLLTMAAFVLTRPVVALEPSPATRAVPAAVAVILIAVFVMVSRRRALSQAIGFLMLDNGITAVAFLTTAGVPVIVELGASLDVLFAILILGVLTGQLRQAFGDTDLDQLRELHD